METPATHQPVHTGEKKYTCANCRKNFSSQQSLRRHQSVHMVEKKYNCEQCGKHFSTTLSLKRHQIYHRREKLFPHCFSPVGIHRCIIRLLLLLKFCPHLSQLYFFSLVWRCWCLLRLELVLNIFPHLSQLYFVSAVSKGWCVAGVSMASLNVIEVVVLGGLGEWTLRAGEDLSMSQHWDHSCEKETEKKQIQRKGRFSCLQY